MTDDKGVSPQHPIEDPGANVLVRAPGCVAAFIAFTLLLTVADCLPFKLPEVILAVAALLLGLGFITMYVRLLRHRWNAAPPDAVQLLGRDLNGIRRMHLADYRLKFPTGTPLQERALHEAAYALKWLGHLLVFAGLGWLLYRLFSALGIIAP